MNTFWKEAMGGIMNIAKDLLVKDHALQPVAFIFKQDEPEVLAIDFNNDEEKYKAHLELGIKCLVYQATAVILINDVAMKRYNGDPKDFDKITSDPLERPLLYPKSMRTEAILLSYLDFTSGERHFLLQPYKDTDGNIEWLPNDISDGTQMESYLLDLVIEGYAKSSANLVKLFKRLNNDSQSPSQ